MSCEKHKIFCSALNYKTKHDTIFYHANERQLQQIALNRSSHIEFKDFLKLYEDNTEETF